MALSKEDHKDVKGALGKAVANKISKVTRDSKPKSKCSVCGGGHANHSVYTSRTGNL